MSRQETFEQEVNKQIRRLESQSLNAIESEVAAKRIAWFQKNFTKNAKCDPPSPRRAYELFLLEYLGLRSKDVPVVSETATEIVWLSQNACPTLEACKRLELDTREICRSAYEKSTQALISQLDPRLRFLRDYSEIRPYSHHCREAIVRVDFEGMMGIAIEEARKSRDEGNKGYGAIVALGHKILGRAHDTATTQRDPSLHAEVNAIQQAVKKLRDTNLSGAVLFSTCEPCPMCSSLAVWANLTTIVYGISIEETHRLGKSRILISADEVARRSPAMIEIIGNVLTDECKELYVS